jgi:hypothetical protein
MEERVESARTDQRRQRTVSQPPATSRQGDISQIYETNLPCSSLSSLKLAQPNLPTTQLLRIAMQMEQKNLESSTGKVRCLLAASYF